MAALTDYGEGLLAGWIRGVALPASPNLHLGLWSGSLTEAGTGGTEQSTAIAGGRVPVGTGVWSAPISIGSDRVIRNSSVFTVTSSAGAGSFSFVTLHDAPTAGNLIFSLSVSAPNPRTVAAGALIDFPANGLAIGIRVGATPVLTNAGIDLFLNWFRGTTPPPPTTWYLALYNGDPGQSGLAGTELTGTIYPSRVAFPASDFTVPTQVVDVARMSNSTLIDFGFALTAGSRTHVAFFDAPIGGTMVLRAAIGGTAAFVAGAPLRFAVGGLVLSVA